MLHQTAGKNDAATGEARQPRVLGGRVTSTCRRPTVLVLCRWLSLLSAVIALPRVATAEPVSIPEFLARQEQFGDLVDSSFHLEGRVSTFSGNELRMKGTDLKFVFNSSLERPKTNNVQIVGRLERDGRNFRIIVQSLSDYKPEQHIIRDRLRAADVNAAETYYGLGQWAEERGKFYQDEELAAEARRLRTLGIQTALRKSKRNDSTELLALGDQAAAWGLEPRLRQELLHVATRVDLNKESGNRVPAYAAILNKIKSRFAGADQPLSEIPQPTRDMYTTQPEQTYSLADDEQRLVLNRLLYVETAIRLAEQDARADGSNGYAVAATIGRLVPEYPELSAKFRARELDYLESRVPQMERAEVLEFRNKLREAGQAERAIAVLRKWIDQQLVRRPKGAETEVDRAELEFELTGDNERALTLVSAAMAVDPQVAGGAELLSLMGYGWHQGKAIRKELVPPPPPDPFAQAIREGRIVVGMSDKQVRAALGGAPDTIVRLASQGGVTELWDYSGQQFTVQLASTRQKPQLAVARILERKPAAK
jgi:hypothetical protein